jgi:hypothetical protein
LEILKVGDHSRGVGVGGNIVLEWILKRQVGSMWIGFNWLRIEVSRGFNNVIKFRAP